MTRYFPLFLELNQSRQILLIGGGNVAAAKLETLKHHKAFLRVKALHYRPDVEKTLIQEQISYEIGGYTPKDLDNIQILIAATNNPILNATIKKEASKRGILVNCVDDKEKCDFIFPALVRRGDLQIAISSGGVSPVLARLLKQKIESIIPQEFIHVIHFLQKKRELVIEKLSQLQPRRLFWEKFLQSSGFDFLLKNQIKNAEDVFTQQLTQQENNNKAILYLISSGCGDPDLITIKGAWCLSRADIILYDRLVAPDIIARYTRKDAIKIEVGKKRGVHGHTQAEIHDLINAYLTQGKIVARLKGGDAGIFAHASEETQIAKNCGAEIFIIPGITAALGCAAYSGISLTKREQIRSVRLITLYDKDVYDDALWHNFATASGETLVFYMSIKHRDLLCSRLIAHGMDEKMPIMAVEQGTTPEHRYYISTLKKFATDFEGIDFISPTLFIVGQTVADAPPQDWDDRLKNSFFDAPTPSLDHQGCKKD